MCYLFSKTIPRATFFQEERVKDFLGNLTWIVSEPHSLGTMSWSLPAASAGGLGHLLYLLVPRVPDSTRKDCRKQQHHPGFLCGKWDSCINYTCPSLFPLATACARTSGYLGPRGKQVWGCHKLKRNRYNDNQEMSLSSGSDWGHFWYIEKPSQQKCMCWRQKIM